MSQLVGHLSLRQRINWRMIVLAAVVLTIVGYPLYLYIDSEVSGGIHAGSNGYTNVDLKAMSVFDFNQTDGTLDDIPKKWRELDGRKVELVGEMYAPNEASDRVHYFELVYSIAKCCFSGPPQVQHFVNSHPVHGAVPNFNSMLVTVKGTLHVRVIPKDGKVASIYQLDVESVEPKT